MTTAAMPRTASDPVPATLSATDTAARRAPAPGPRPESARTAPTRRSARTWQHDPLLSTLRDLGGCMAVIAMGVLITVLVCAAHAACPPAHPTSSPVDHHISQDQR